MAELKYTKKPVEVEAMQWDGLLNTPEIKKFVGDALIVKIDDSAWQVGIHPPVVSMKIKTLEGNMEVSKGDYIIKGIKGEFYPCKEDIFLASYDISENKKAKELFQDLGFTEKENQDLINYTKGEADDEEISISFQKKSKKYYLSRSYYYEYSSVCVSNELNKAINKQMEELGWL